MRITQHLSSSPLRSEIKQIIPSPLRRGARARVLAAAILMLLLSARSTAFAGSATWNLNPTNALWDTATNWTPATVPNGPADTATFDLSNSPFVFIGLIEVNGIVFNAGASAFTIDIDGGLLTLSGVGIANNSGIAQNFVAAGEEGSEMTFTNNATAGSLSVFTIQGGQGAEFSGGSVEFFDNSTAADGTFINQGSNADGEGGFVAFSDNSTAADGTFITEGGTCCFPPGEAVTSFSGNSTAANATLIANGGDVGGGIWFKFDSTGGTARVEVFDDGNLDISGHNPPGVTVGSIEGSGVVFLGVNNLTVGSNSLNTTFSGVIQDGGSLTKVGQGTLILTNANTYAGGTTVEQGTLVVNNVSGSGTGTGAVQVNAGVLGGKGTITGAVTVGTGSGRRAMLDPGRPGTNKPGHFLGILGALILNSDATYNVGLMATDQTVDEVMANGVTINGAQFHFAVHGRHVLSPGTVFTVLENTAATPIAGAFSNLPDGSLITANGHTFQASYEGGTGNDLTLTVVP